MKFIMTDEITEVSPDVALFSKERFVEIVEFARNGTELCSGLMAAVGNLLNDLDLYGQPIGVHAIKLLRREYKAAQLRLQSDVCRKCGSTEFIEYPEDPRYFVCSECGTRR